MAIRESLKKVTNEPGLFFNKHETRNHGIKKDTQWVLRQTLGGATRVSVLGWETEGVKKGNAINKRDEFKSNHKWNSQNPDQPKKPICIADEKATQELKADENPTFKEFAERFLRYYVRAKLKPKTVIEYERHLKKVFIPKWGERKLTDISRKQIIRFIEKLADEAPIQANRKLATLKKMFSYAVDTATLDSNPATGIKPPARENVKDRVLSLDDLSTVFSVLKEQENRDTRDILQLIALTGQRPGEVATMHRSQLVKELDGTWWNMAGADTKNNKPHRAYLNDQAIHIINARIADLELDHYIFTATKKDGTTTHPRPDVTVSRTRKIMPLMEARGIEKFTAHDLRRSAATGIAKLGHSAVVPDILNHKPQGITRLVYDKYSRQPEIKRALTSWGEAIQRAIGGTQADVIEIKANQ